MSDTSWSLSVPPREGASRSPRHGDYAILDAVLPLLYGWLPEQRWFAGKGRPIAEIRPLAATELATPSHGSPGLLHLLLRVEHLDTPAEAALDPVAGAGRPGGSPASAPGGDCYQLMLGMRSALPAFLRPALIDRVDGGPHDGMLVYDAPHDPHLAGLILDHLAKGGHVDTLRFHHCPGADLPTHLQARVGTAEQSNTSVVYGDALILKLFRRVSPGVNPDLELSLALSRAGCERVPEPVAWFDTPWPDRYGPAGRYRPTEREPDAGGEGEGEGQGDADRAGDTDRAGGVEHGADATGGSRATGRRARPGGVGEPTTLGLLQRFLPGSADGWELALASVPGPHDRRTDDDFTGESYLLGQATAEVHTVLAHELPTTVLDERRIADLADGMAERLDDAAAAVPELRPYRPALRSAFHDLAALGREGRSLTAQRIHGDLHLGQVLRTTEGWVLLDFEGEPAQPVEERRRLQPAVRDVAAMLRSFDYAAQYRLVAPGEPPGDRRRAEEWAERNRAAFCSGYAAVGDQDPAAERVVMRAFETDKAVYECLYEARHRPGWLPVPMSAIARLAAQSR